MLPERLEPFLEPIMAMCRSQFPRACGSCKRQFVDFKQFVCMTDPIGALMPMFEEPDNDPFGIISWVNCKCGSTLLLHCEDMNGAQHHQFMRVLHEESDANGRSVRDLLLNLRERIRQRVIDDV